MCHVFFYGSIFHISLNIYVPTDFVRHCRYIRKTELSVQITDKDDIFFDFRDLLACLDFQ